jgi:hypothetical protein
MTELNFTPIIIVSSWKTGSTLLQAVLSKSDNICNLFPDEDVPDDWEGAHFWKEHGIHIVHKKYGNYLKPEYYKNLDRDTIIKELNDRHDGKSKYGLIKRPQFVFNLNFIKWLMPNAIIIGLKRDYLPTIYSHLRLYKTYGIVGAKPANWTKYFGDSVSDYSAWSYFYVNKIMDANNIPCITYEDLTDNTEQTIEKIGDIIGEKLNIDYDYSKIKNFNDAYKRGGGKDSRTVELKKKGIDLEKSKEKVMSPLTQKQIDYIMSIKDKYKDVEISDIFIVK